MIKNKQFVNVLLVMVLATTLASCAPANTIKINSPISGLQNQVEVPREPPYFIGAYNMGGVNIERGEFQAKLGFFPRGLYAEMSPGRTTYFGWTVDEKKQGHLLQVIFTPWGELLEKADGKNVVAIYATLVYSKKIKSGKAIIFSTEQEYIYDASQKYPDGISLDWERFKTDERYRNEVTIKYGTELSQLPQSEVFNSSVRKWRPNTTPEGIKFFSPLLTKDMKEVARINPGCTFFQRWVRDGEFYLSPNLFTTGISAFFDLYRASKKQPIAWSMGSMINREDMLFVNRYLSEIERMVIINQIGGKK
ncbi:MAG: hypothetical protein WCO05_03870 [Candidatus Moraniibacteriota bacterium]